MEFPHLGDTQFPLLGNVNVYQYKNNFDYTRWKQNTKIRLTNVLWDSDYHNVVKFETNAIRDNWFDENPDQYEITLTSDHSIPPEGGIKLPIPFDVATRYNYLVVDVPIMTGPDNPIEYEDVSNGIRRWFFFVNEVSSRAPNTTMFNISLDVWMQFHNDIDFNYMFLERGHAPVAATDTERYLANPIENNTYLLTPDVTPSVPSVVRNSAFIPFGNGSKLVCIVSTVPPDGLSQLGAIVQDPAYAYGTPVYSDYPDRIGYQLNVDGIGVGDGYDYSSLNNPSTTVNPYNATVGSSYYTYAISAEECYGSGTFFSDVMETCPSFMNTIAACFIVAEQMVSHYAIPLTIAGHDVTMVIGSREEFAFPKLSVSDFGYPDVYGRFAKLFTYPYASLELTDNEGEVINVRIENTGDIKYYRETMLAYPSLDMRIFFTGINGVGSTQYQWVALDGTVLSELEMPNSDWFEHCFDHEIPTFTIFMDAQKSWIVDNFHDKVKASMARAKRDYQNLVRPTNATHQNTRDTASTNDTNVDADAGTLVTNTDNAANAARANMDVTMAANVDKNDFSVMTANLIVNTTHNRDSDSVDAANTASLKTVAVQQAVSVQSAQKTGEINLAAGAATAVGGSLVSGAAAAAGLTALAATAAPIAVAAGIGLIATQANAHLAGVLVTQTNQADLDVLNATMARNTDELNIGHTFNQASTALSNGAQTYSVNTDNNTLDSHTDMNNALMRANAANNAATMRANSGRNKATAQNNADWTHIALINNGKQSLETALLDANSELAERRMAAPRAIGSDASSNMADYFMTRGIQVKVRTLPDSEVRQVGDWFARYGYALEMMWDVTDQGGLCPMNHFCYWKCRDIWVDDRNSSNGAAIIMIKSMFQRGVTVWKNPDEVGRVRIYDN